MVQPNLSLFWLCATALFSSVQFIWDALWWDETDEWCERGLTLTCGLSFRLLEYAVDESQYFDKVITYVASNRHANAHLWTWLQANFHTAINRLIVVILLSPHHWLYFH